MALLDNGAQVNTVTPRYVKECSLLVGPITNLMGSKVACVGLSIIPRPIRSFTSAVRMILGLQEVLG